jgi:hypothetical protein
MFSNEDHAILKDIVYNVVVENQNFFNKYCIDYGIKKENWVLNYRQGEERNQVNRLCRGLVVNQATGTIVSFPFTRFFNYGEKEADSISFPEAEIMEKMDGSLVAVSFPSANIDQPLWQTRKMLSTFDSEFIGKSFKGDPIKLINLIGQYVKKLNFTNGHLSHTWMFEFIHEHTRVITNYENNRHGLYLIGGRNLHTYSELSENYLDRVAQEIGAKRPRRWSLVETSHEEVVKLFESQPKDFEGFIARQKNTPYRVKIKSEDYLKRHHLLTNTSYKRLLPLWFSGEHLEVLAYLPHILSKIETIEIKFSTFVKQSVAAIDYWDKKNLSRKDLALQMMAEEKDSVVRGLVFQYDTEKKKGNVDPVSLVTNSLKKKSVTTLIETLNLIDDDAILEHEEN